MAGVPARRLGVGEPAAWFRDGAAKGARGVHPLLNDDLCISDRFLIGRTVGHAAGKLGHLGDEAFVGLAPVDDEFVAHITRSRIGI